MTGMWPSISFCTRFLCDGLTRLMCAFPFGYGSLVVDQLFWSYDVLLIECDNLGRCSHDMWYGLWVVKVF